MKCFDTDFMVIQASGIGLLSPTLIVAVNVPIPLTISFTVSIDDK